MAERVSTNRATHQIVVFGISDRGLQRDNNEDHFMVADLARKVIGVHANQLLPDLLHHDIGPRGTVLMVADGLGGHEGGEIASQLAVETIAQSLINPTEPDLPVPEQIVRAIDLAHEAICKYHGVHGRTRHMASTLTLVHVGQKALTIAQIGDSRAYRFSGGKLTLLTEDQTVVHMMQKKGMLTAEEAQHHPHRNIILQALGQDKAVAPELQTLPFQHNDCLLLCSDGLSSYVAHEHIEAIMASGEDEHVRCRRLVDAANAAGGADNVTVLLARLIVREAARPAAVPPAPGHPLQRVQQRPAPRAPERPAVPSPAVQRAGQRAPEPPQSSPTPPEPPAPQPPIATPPPESSAAEKAPQSARTIQVRLPWLTKDDKAPPASEPARTPLWKREIKWPWGHRAPEQAAPPALESPADTPQPHPSGSTPPQAPAHAQTGQAAVDAAWDPAVLKAVADSLAQYIGPVAKILVNRAASQTTDLQALCQALAAQLSTEQERDSFLRSALQSHQPSSRRS